MADGSRRPIESLRPGDMVQSLELPGLAVDVPEQSQYEWLSTCGVDHGVPRESRVGSVKLGSHDGFYLINGRIKATFEHPFLVRRDNEWGFASAENLAVGDLLIRLSGGVRSEEEIETIERVDYQVATVAIHVPGVNTYVADGVVTHNDTIGNSSSTGSTNLSGVSSGSASLLSTSGSSSSASSSSAKSSGSSFSASGSGSSSAPSE